MANPGGARVAGVIVSDAREVLYYNQRRIGVARVECNPDSDQTICVGGANSLADLGYITKTFEYKLRTNRKFVAACEQTLDSARFVYNCALEHRLNIYRETGRGVNFYEQSRQLTEARREMPEIKATLRTIQSDALERLDHSFDAFFKRGHGHPRFKGRDRYHTFSQKYEAVRPCPLKGDKLTVPGVGTVRVRLSRPMEGTVKQLRITRRADGWYALLVCRLERPGAPAEDWKDNWRGCRLDRLRDFERRRDHRQPPAYARGRREAGQGAAPVEPQTQGERQPQEGAQ